jgi:predicted transcriptional regulator
MADVLDDVVVSEMPDFTRVPLEHLADAPAPPTSAVIERAIAHPLQDQQVQAS